MRERLRPIHEGKVRCCGRWALTDRLSIVRKGDQAYVEGTMRCGRVWLCPWCSAVIGQARVEDIAEAVRRHVEGGGAVYLLTRTVRHRAGLALAAVLEVLLTARSDLVRSWAWRQQAKALGILGTIKSVEITTSKARGWHPHLHELVFTERPLSNEDFGRWWLGMRQPWANAVSRHDPSLRPEDRLIRLGVDVRRIDNEDADTIAGYLTKDELSGAALEVARPEAKVGRSESLGPFELGERAAGGDQWALARWREYEQATRGRHRLSWSRGLRARLGMTDERSAEEIMDEAEHDEVVAELDADESALLLFVPELGPLCCEAAERDGASGVHRVLGAAWRALSWSEQVRVRRWGEGRFRVTGWAA
jgi:hypothetical protein